MSISNDELMDAMIQIHQGIYKLMELLKEHEFPQFSNGVQRYHSEQGKLPFQVATQFDQPAEFLQSLLDMLKVQFEPYPMGTLLLNSNVVAHMAYHLDKDIEKFHYLSVIGEPHQTPRDIWNMTIGPYLRLREISFKRIKVALVAVMVSETYYSIRLAGEMADMWMEGLEPVADTLEDHEIEEPYLHYGFGTDEGLKDKIRISVWSFYT